MRHFTRRDFTRHLGLAALFSPFIALLNNEPAKAQAGKAKYLFIFFTNGTEPAVWSPRGSSDSSISFSQMTELLSPLKSNLILIEKLSSHGTANSHAAPGGLTGMGHGAPIHISLDQFVSDALRNAGVRTQIPNLVLGGVPTEQQSTFFRDGRAITPIASPTQAYQAIFSGGGGLDPSTTAPTAAEERLRRKRSVLDLMTRELNQLSQALGAQEREKLEMHAESIRQLEQRLAAQAGEGDPNGGVIPVTCNAPGGPGNGSEPLRNSVILMDLAIQAFACDITRVASVQFGHHQSTQVSIPEVGAPGDWHNGFMHSDNPRTRLVNLERWLCQQFVAAADKLKSLPAPDGNGTLFDQTVMLWARDMGDAVAHDGSDMRFVISGGAGGYFRYSGNGRYIAGNGDYHMRVLVAAGDAMGVTSWQGFGDPAAPASARTPLSGLS